MGNDYELVESNHVFDSEVDANITKLLNRLDPISSVQKLPPNPYKEKAEANERADQLAKINYHSNQIAFDEFIKDYSVKHGVSLNSFNDLTEFVKFIQDPNQVKALEIISSKYFAGLKLRMFVQLTVAVSAMITDITNIDNIQRNLTFDERIEMVDKILNMFQRLQELSDQLEVPNADLELRKIRQEIETPNEVNKVDPNFLSKLLNTLKSSVNNDAGSNSN